MSDSGLELLLLIKDPWQVFLSTDHPNGGCFWRYPEIIKLLMCADFRKECLTQLPDSIKGKITLPEIDREYTIESVRSRNRHVGWSSHETLGLTKIKGTLVSATMRTWLSTKKILAMFARTFSHPRYVIQAGEIVMEEGDIRETPESGVPDQTGSGSGVFDSFMR